MENIHSKGTEEKSITSPSGESLGKNIHMRRSKHVIKYSHRYDTVLRASREWKSDYVAIIVYMIQDGIFKKNVDMDEMLSLLTEWDTEYCMDVPLTFYIREFYAIMSQIYDTVYYELGSLQCVQCG